MLPWLRAYHRRAGRGCLGLGRGSLGRAGEGRGGDWGLAKAYPHRAADGWRVSCDARAMCGVARRREAFARQSSHGRVRGRPFRVRGARAPTPRDSDGADQRGRKGSLGPWSAHRCSGARRLASMRPPRRSTRSRTLRASTLGAARPGSGTGRGAPRGGRLGR